MAENFITVQVAVPGTGTVSVTDNFVDTVEHIGGFDQYYSEYRYHWNCATVQATPAPGYVFDHWEKGVVEKWYGPIPDPGGQSPLEYTWTYYKGPEYSDTLQITIKDGDIYPNYGSDSPGYSEVDAYIPLVPDPGIPPDYYRPWLQHYWTFTAYFKKVTPSYTNLPVYSISTGKLMYHMTANKLLRDSP